MLNTTVTMNHLYNNYVGQNNGIMTTIQTHLLYIRFQDQNRLGGMSHKLIIISPIKFSDKWFLATVPNAIGDTVNKYKMN